MLTSSWRSLWLGIWATCTLYPCRTHDNASLMPGAYVIEPRCVHARSHWKSRVFEACIAYFLCSRHPSLFSFQRFCLTRGERIWLQHATNLCNAASTAWIRKIFAALNLCQHSLEALPLITTFCFLKDKYSIIQFAAVWLTLYISVFEIIKSGVQRQRLF